MYLHKAAHSLKTMFIKIATSDLPSLNFSPEIRGVRVRARHCGRIWPNTLLFIWSAGILSRWPVTFPTGTQTHTSTHCQHLLSAINLSITSQVEPFIHTIQACGYSLGDLHTPSKEARGCSTWLGFLMLSLSIVHWNASEPPYCSRPGKEEKSPGITKFLPWRHAECRTAV